MPASRVGESPQGGGPFNDVAHAATSLGREMRQCVSGILQGGTSVRAFAAALALDKSLAWKVHAIATASEPIDVLVALPGHPGMSKVMRALGALGIETAALDRARLALNGLLHARGISRSQLKSMATGHSGGAADLRALRQLHRRAFECASAIRGMFMRGTAVAIMIAPGPTGATRCMVASSMLHRLGRCRPSGLLPVYFITRVQRPGASPAGMTDPHAQRPSRAALLRQFSSPSVTPDMLNVREFEHGEALCLDAAQANLEPVDLSFRQVIHGVRANRSEGPSAADIDLFAPTEHVLVDLMLHQSLAATVRSCDLFIRAAPEGVHRGFPDFMRHPIPIDARWSKESRMPTPFASAGARWEALLAESASIAGSTPSEFRTYRMRLEYPPTPSTLRVLWSPETGKRTSG